MRVCVRVFGLHAAATTLLEDRKREDSHKYTPSLVYTIVCVLEDGKRERKYTLTYIYQCERGCCAVVAVLCKCTKTMYINRKEKGVHIIYIQK